MICAGITYDSVNDRIKILYDAADGTKGASFTDAYTFDDIYDTDVANNWGVVVKQGTQFVFYTGLYIDGSLTFFQDDNKDIYWNIHLTSYKYLLDIQYTNIIFGSYGGCMSFRANRLSSSYHTFCRINRNYECRITNTLFDWLRLIFTGHQGYANTLDNVSIYVLSNTDLQFDTEVKHFIQYQGFCTWNYNLNIADVIDLKQGANLYHNFVGNNTVTIRNINFYDGGYVRIYLTGINTNSIVNLVDSNFDGYISISTYAGFNGFCEYIYNLKTTFSLLLDVENYHLIVYDLDDNIVDEQDITDIGYSEELTFRQDIFYNPPLTTSYTRETNYKHPFRLVATKAGYDDLVIPDIYVTAGQPTIIRGSMVATEPTPPTIISVDLVNPDILNDYNGEITINASGGTSPYTYSINGINYETENTFTGLSGGTYSVYVRDNNNLIDSIDGIDLTTLTSTPPTITSVVVIDSDMSATPNGSIKIFATGGTSPYIYSLNDNPFQNTDIFLNLAGGIYSIRVKDSNGLITTLSGIKVSVIRNAGGYGRGWERHKPYVNVNVNNVEMKDTENNEKIKIRVDI